MQNFTLILAVAILSTPCLAHYIDDTRGSSPSSERHPAPMTTTAEPPPTPSRHLFDRTRRIPSYRTETEEQRLHPSFPEVDERGFDEDVFDESFGDWSPMRF